VHCKVSNVQYRVGNPVALHL